MIQNDMPSQVQKTGVNMPVTSDNLQNVDNINVIIQL